MRRAETVGTGVASTDDDDPLARGENGPLFRDRVARDAAVALLEKLHGKMDPAELAPGHRQIARAARTAAEDDGVMTAREARRR